MEFPSDKMQKELEQNPSKLLDLISNAKQIQSKIKTNNQEPSEKMLKNKKANNENINNEIIKNKNKENLNKKSLFEDSKKKNEKSLNINFNFFSINDILTNINNIEYINKINSINNQFIVNENYIDNIYYMNGINNKINNNINIIENSKINDNFSRFSNNYVNTNIHMKNMKNKNIFYSNNKYILLNNVNIILMHLQTQKGSIIIQDFLKELNDSELDRLFDNLTPYITSIMCSEYGNYFIQKLIKKLNLKQRLKIYEIMNPNFIEIATNKSGTHSIQSLIDCIETPLKFNIFDKLLEKNRLLFFLDDNAYHIIMKIILEIDEDKRTNINIFLTNNVDKIITNVNGAFCVNKFIHKNIDINLRVLLVQNLKNNLTNIINNKYSCSILLLILEKFGTNYGLFILKYIQKNFATLSQYPTTVVLILKILNYLYKYNTFELGILIWYVYKNNNLLNYLLSNQNGNQILKLMINLSDQEQKKFIFLKLNHIQ